MAKERVQVQGLGDVVPGIQPTIQRGGQYAVQVQRAGRNKLMDLADALGQVNPILSEFGNIRKLEQQRKQKLEEALQEEGYRAFKTDPATMAVELERTQQKIRAAVERGEIPDEANSARSVGALKAKAEVLAKRDYRNILNNPELLLTTKDPVVEALKQREEFFNREEFQSPIVRDHAIKFFEEVENEFINTVEKRLAAFEVEEGKGFWLELAEEPVDQFIKGDLSLDSEELTRWINDPAGIFKGSNKYALDNLFKPALMDVVEAGGSAIALEKLDEIENWVINPRTGAKFINAELKNDIATFKRDIEAKDTYFKNKTKNLYTTNKEKVLNPLVTEFKGKLNDGDIITDSYLKEWTNRVREAGSTFGVFGLDIEETIQSMIELSNKDYYNADTGDVKSNTSVWTALQADLDKGIDVLPDAQDALERGDLAWNDFKDIQKRNGDSDRFNKEIMEGVVAIKRATESFGNQFKDTTLTEEMRIRGITPPTTNFVKNITGLNAHPNTLDTLKLRGLLSWRNKVKETRDNILKANPNTTPQQLDEALTNQSLELYEAFNEEYKETVLSQLRTGQYIIDNDQTITVKMLDKAITGIETGNPSLIDLKIEDLILKLEFSDNLEERLQFLRTYKNKIK
jgi:hypothetical protein